ncbi:MAG TPA: C2H2-type zinc finger protein [Candidatus Nitrosotalea sp.]|nr:C2H2-type zinc finger protein [Candidatus Nitrosotalea sp.]
MSSLIAIDCAGDSDLALELGNYLKNLGITAKVEESFVNVDKAGMEHTLMLFLKETGRSDYKIRKIDSATFLLSKEVSIEDFNLQSCEMCGYVTSNESELMNHRRVHGLV